MITKLTQEQLDALEGVGNAPLPLVDPRTDRIYVLVDQHKHEEALAALRSQQDLAAIERGVDDMEAGRTVSRDQGRQQARRELLTRFEK